MTVPPAGPGAASLGEGQFRARFPSAYTDAPELHRSPIVATLQLFVWLFFHPSAWRNHIARIDPALPPDFNLAQLTREQWRNRELRRLLLLGHVLAPLLIAAALMVELMVLRVPPRFIAIRVCACLLMTIVCGIANGTGGWEAAGIASGMMGAMAGSAAFGVAALLTGQVTFQIDSSVSAMVADFLAGGPAGLTTLIVAFGVALGGMFVGVSGAVGQISRRRTQSTRRPYLGGTLVGLFIGAFFLVAATSAALFLPFSIGISAGGFLAGTISAAWVSRSWLRSLVFGVACALNNHLMVNVICPLTHDVVVIGSIMGFILGAWFSLPYVLAEEIAGSWAGAVAGSLGFSGGWLLTLSAASTQHMSLGAHFLPGLLSLEAGVLLGLTEVVWRPLLLFPLEEAWNLVLYRADAGRGATDRPSWLRLHTAFVDELQRWPLYGLDEHLVLVTERNPEEGRLAMERVARGPQRWAAQAAQIELDARRLERCADVAAAGRALRDLGSSASEGPASAVIGSFARLSQDIEAALSQASSHNQRLGLSAVQQRLDALIAQLDRSSDRHAVRFRPVAADWRHLVANHVRELAEAAELRQEIDNPYVIGVPLTLQQELFVGRTDVSARIEQLLVDRRRPPLLLYGPRRMGKTSLLNNLGRLLPTTIVPLFVDLQGPASAASDHAGLLYNLARGMIDSARKQRNVALPPLPREALVADPFTTFDEWLDRVEACLDPCTALLALDEFEALDRALEEGRFSEHAVLGMLRHLVQHRRRMKVLLASSRTMEELSRCSSYLINVQVVQVGFLKEDEARRLIEHPVENMVLRYEPEASGRVLSLTQGHPFLVQLLCAEIITLKNEQEPATRRLATVADVLAAVPAALSHGSFFFADIERNQVDAAGLAVLRRLAAMGEGVGAEREALRDIAGDLDATLTRLQRRDLIEQDGGAYRFRVEMIRRWFTQAR